MTKQQALDFVNTLDTRHQAVQPILRSLIRGEAVSEAAIAELDSPFDPLKPIFRDVLKGGVFPTETHKQIATLDTRNEVLKPLLNALADGLS